MERIRRIMDEYMMGHRSDFPKRVICDSVVYGRPEMWLSENDDELYVIYKKAVIGEKQKPP